MSDKSQELAISLLEEAKEKGTLDPAIKSRLAKLIGAEIRSKVEETLEAPVAAEEEKRELTPKQADRLVSTLKSRFELPDNEKLRKALDWTDVEKSLRAAPEKLYVLQKLEETGGEPQVIGIDGDEFVFEDRSAESPSGRRDLNANQAAAQAEEFGVGMQSPDAYKAMQKTGKYDLKSWSWLKTDLEKRKRTGGAFYGYRAVGGVRVSEDVANHSGPYRGWRASLRVKKA